MRQIRLDREVVRERVIFKSNKFTVFAADLDVRTVLVFAHTIRVVDRVVQAWCKINLVRAFRCFQTGAVHCYKG
jgi:hypothetical protein